MTIHPLVDLHHRRLSARQQCLQSFEAIITAVWQGAQEADARMVAMTTDTIVQITHDGQSRPLHVFLTPLVDEPLHPMAVGIHGLLANPDIERLVIRSGPSTLTIDTHQWWHDSAYALSWAERVTITPEPCHGVQLEIHGTPAAIRSIHGIVTTTCFCTPFQRSLNGVLLSNQLPDWALPQRILIETEYNGHRLVIGVNDDRHDCTSSIQWHGTVLRTSLRMKYSPFTFYLEVQHGEPLTVLVPSRWLILDDSRLKHLQDVVCSAIYDYVFDPTNAHVLQPRWVEECYRLLPERCMASAPLFVGYPWQDGDTDSACIEDLAPRSDQPTVLHYADQPVVIEPTLFVVHPTGSIEPLRYGLSRFIPYLDRPAYHRVCGNPERIHTHRLYWRPGPSMGGVFYESGSWALGTPAGITAWTPIETLVFGFNTPSRWDVMDVDFVVGITDPTHKRIFYETLAWAGFTDDPCAQHDSDTLWEAYAETCEDALLEQVTDCVPRLNLAGMRRWIADPQHRIRTLSLIYDEGCSEPRAVRVVTETGAERVLTFL